jgi:hypothetical protein
MRRFFSLSVVIVLASIALASCNSAKKSGGTSGSGGVGAGTATAPAQNIPADGVRRVTYLELRDALDQGTAIVVDTRGADSYKQSHIKGSISMPLEQVPTRINELPRDKMIVTYCS